MKSKNDAGFDGLQDSFLNFGDVIMHSCNQSKYEKRVCSKTLANQYINLHKSSINGGVLPSYNGLLKARSKMVKKRLPEWTHELIDLSVKSFPSGGRTILGDLSIWKIAKMNESGALPNQLYLGDPTVDVISLFYTTCIEPNYFEYLDETKTCLENFFNRFLTVYYEGIMNSRINQCLFKQYAFLPAYFLGTINKLAKLVENKRSCETQINDILLEFLEFIPFLGCLPVDMVRLLSICYK